ncbi:cadherin domain-containing protein [Desertivirga arenae]|uniref:cadherin domain-containing protein n=1 Tax=Desertivirga arenae TaxID=2810309 RepID=UPI001A9791EF|nr:cadherin domain-containing protein [Pedobacter sp. SYSU D00823]
MKKFLLISFVLMLAATISRAQAPLWSVNSQDYAYQMALVAAINIDGVEADNSNTTLAAFINDECRGVGKLTYIASVNRYMVYMNIYSNSGEGTVKFKLYDAKLNRTVNIEQTEPFEIQKLTGSTSAPLVVSYPRLSSEAKFFTYKLPGQEKSEIVGNDINVVVPFGSSLNNLIAEYTTPEVAKVSVGTQVQTSKVSANTFSSPVIYKIIAPDETKSAEFKVSVKYGNATPVNITLSNLQLSENSPIGTLVGNLQGVDPDGDLNFVYSLVAGTGSTDNTYFQINDNKLSLAKKLDFEVKEFYSLRVKADDGKGGLVEKVLTVTALNENDTAPVVLTKSITIPENQESETLVYRMELSDADGSSVFTYRISDGNQDGKFSIHEQKGEIKIAKAIDYETDKRSFTLEVMVNDGKNESRALITFNIQNLNDNAPVVKEQTIQMSEKAVLGSLVHQLLPADADGVTTFTYRIVNTNPLFEVTPQGLILVKAGLDYEKAKSHSLRIGIADGANEAFYTFNVQLQNENDEKPLLVKKQIELNEKTAPGTVITQLEATDPDKDGSPITFTLLQTDSPFQLASDGTLTLKKTLSYSSYPNYKLRISLYDGVNTSEEEQEITVIQDATVNFQPANVITPNGDGINDTWEIKDGHLYENYTFKVISSQGREVFFQKGYKSPFWDGRFQGKDLPVGTYIYIAQSDDKTKTFKGTLSILR